MNTLSVAHVSTFSPTQCGIATYAEDLISHLTRDTPTLIRLSYDDEPLAAVDHTLRLHNRNAYEEASTYINTGSVDVVSLQHEFGIYGGKDGEYVINLVQASKRPVVTTLHTVKPALSEHRRRIINALAAASARVIVLTVQSARTLEILGVPGHKIAVIPHGIPNVPFVAPQATALRKRLGASLVFVSAGHRRRTKGYHIALEALAQYKQTSEDFKFVIVGTHQSQFAGAASYCDELHALVERLGLTKHVVWVDRYLSRDDLLQYIMAADIGLVTYTGAEQNASGILPLFLGCGRIVIATRFACATALHPSPSGLVLAALNDPRSVATAITLVTSDAVPREDLMSKTYEQTRPWLWSETAQAYRSAFVEAVAQYPRGAANSRQPDVA
jgi:glycosyltransferase involved in cell wall biosynthesis